MISLRSIIPVLLILSAMRGVSPMQQFEGYIDIVIRIPGLAGETEESIQRQYIRLPHVRIEPVDESGGMVVLVDNARKYSYVLDTHNRSYSESAFSELADEYTSQAQESQGTYTVERKPASRSILGHDAVGYDIRIQGDEAESYDRIEVWATQRLGDLYNELIRGMQSTRDAGRGWQTYFTERNLFPLITITYFEDLILETTEVVRIQRQQLDPSMFVIPSGYRLIDKR